MSDSNPFSNMPIFGDIARMLSNQGPVNWDVAGQLATWVATEGQDEPNPDPLERIAFSELLRVAELHVGQFTGLPTAPAGGLLRVVTVTRRDWAARTLSETHEVLERLATALSAVVPEAQAGAESGDTGHPSDRAGREAMAMMGDLGRMISPVLLGVQAGSMMGHLARRAFGRYDLTIPRPLSDELLVVPANLNVFIDEWSLPPDDFRLWVALRDVGLHAVLSLPHVHRRLTDLLLEYVGAFHFDPHSLEAGLGQFDPTDPAGMSAMFSNPDSLMGLLVSPAQEGLLRRIEAVVLPVIGYVDHLLATLGPRLISSYAAISEAMTRRRVEESDGDRFVGRLLGLELGRSQYERAHAFIAGVVNRSDAQTPGRLWAAAANLPTVAEIDAPGLWLARIDLPLAGPAG